MAADNHVRVQSAGTTASDHVVTQLSSGADAKVRATGLAAGMLTATLAAMSKIGGQAARAGGGGTLERMEAREWSQSSVHSPPRAGMPFMALQVANREDARCRQPHSRERVCIRLASVERSPLEHKAPHGNQVLVLKLV